MIKFIFNFSKSNRVIFQYMIYLNKQVNARVLLSVINQHIHHIQFSTKCVRTGTAFLSK